jgi:hypothetical protein
MIVKTRGHYQRTSQAGKGGIGEVCLANDLNLNCKGALKSLPEAFAADLERQARFKHEAKLRTIQTATASHLHDQALLRKMNLQP